MKLSVFMACALVILANLAQTAQANNYSYGGYNNYNNYNSGSSVTYTGMAWGSDSAGNYSMMPVSTCPYGCAVNQ